MSLQCRARISPCLIPVVTASTDLEVEINKSIDFVYSYGLQFTNKVSGSYNHHMLTGFETEWTSVLDFDITLVWDRIKDPRPDSADIVPEQDDYRMIVSLGVEF